MAILLQHLTAIFEMKRGDPAEQTGPADPSASVPTDSALIVFILSCNQQALSLLPAAHICSVKPGITAHL